MNFSDELATLVAREMADAKGDADRMGTAIERLSASLGLTIALACRGDAAAIDQMIAGAEGYIHAEAVEKAKFARFMISKGIRA